MKIIQYTHNSSLDGAEINNLFASVQQTVSWETPIKETPPCCYLSFIIGTVHAIKFNSTIRISIAMIRTEFIFLVCETTNLELGTVGNLMGIWCNWRSYWLKIQSILLLDFIQHGNGSCGARSLQRSSPHISHIYNKINQEQNRDGKYNLLTKNITSTKIR